jgi:hypothetical protein
MEPKPGLQTSEGRLTVVQQVLGTIAAAAGALPQNNPYVQITLIVVGALMNITAHWKYTGARADVKKATLPPFYQSQPK